MMTDLFEKSIATLELPRVLEQLAACLLSRLSSSQQMHSVYCHQYLS